MPNIVKTLPRYCFTVIFASIFLFSFGIVVHNAFADTVIATIPVGNNPAGIGVNYNTNMIFVANSGNMSRPGNTVSVINGATNSVVSTISVASIPHGVGVNPTTNKIYVTNIGHVEPGLHAEPTFVCDSTVSVIDGSANSVVGTIQVGSCPVGASVNPKTNMIYVANYVSYTVSAINGTTNTVVSTIPVGAGPRDVSVNPNTNMIYVANYNSNSISVINGATNTVVSTIPVGSLPDYVSVNPKTNMIYESNVDVSENTVYVIDGATNAVTSIINVSGPASIGVNPNTNMIYVANRYGVMKIDGSTNSVVSSIPVGAGSIGAAANPNTNMIYVDNSGNSVAVINGSSSNTTVPSAPTNLSATAVSPSQINLSWTAPTNNGGSAVTGYKIERSTDGGTTWNTIVASTSHSWYSDYFLSASTTYTYRVSAINAIGTSLPSSTASATTSPATIPDPPRYLTPTVVSPSQINLSWWKPVNSGGSAITGYKIESSTDGGTTWNIVTANTGSALYINHYSNTGLLPSTTYTYRVSTINAIGTSLPSSTASATTSPAT